VKEATAKGSTVGTVLLQQHTWASGTYLGPNTYTVDTVCWQQALAEHFDPLTGVAAVATCTCVFKPLILHLFEQETFSFVGCASDYCLLYLAMLFAGTVDMPVPL
jgi:hypothetical protein